MNSDNFPWQLSVLMALIPLAVYLIVRYLL